MLNLNKDNFKTEVLDSKTPVLVDFWSFSCGPCKMLEPILKSIEEKTTVKIAKLEVSDGMDIFKEYNVSYVPTLILFKDGKAVDRKGGLLRENALLEWLK